MANKTQQNAQFDKIHKARLNKYAKQIEALYKKLAQEAARLGISTGFEQDEEKPKQFSFDSYPQTKKQAEKLFEQMNDDLMGVVRNGCEKEWDLSADKYNDMMKNVLRGTGYKTTDFGFPNPRRIMAWAAWQSVRKADGFDLSKRIWGNTKQAREHIEWSITDALMKGTSASDLARTIKQDLVNPDSLFRRVRNHLNKLVPSVPMAAYHPGRGVYRSSYKNALRMAATEINIAYHEADNKAWQQDKFVIGIEIILSNNHPVVDICDDFASYEGHKVVFPPTFNFVGWHPNCRCVAVPVTPDRKEVIEYIKRKMNGEDMSNYHFKGEVTEMPKEFTGWMEANKERLQVMQKQGNLPLWVRRNEGLISLKPQKLEVAKDTSNADYKEWLRLSTQEKVAKLNEIGFSVRDKEVYEKSIVKEFDLFTLNNDLENMCKANGITINYRDITIKENRFSIEYYGDNGFVLDRTFTKKDGVYEVHHNMFVIDKELQGKGISKSVFRALYKQYKNAGVDKMVVQANIDVGGYTWARYGFLADDKYEVIRGLGSKMTDKLKKEVVSFVESYYKGKDDYEPFPMNILAEKFGKPSLLGGSWYGHLDLRSEVQRKIFEKYLGL